MEFNFTVYTEKTILINKDKYPLFWLSDQNKYSPADIGTCIVQLFKNHVNCIGTLATGGFQSSINDIITAEFISTNVALGKYKYGILHQEDENGIEYVYGFYLS